MKEKVIFTIRLLLMPAVFAVAFNTFVTLKLMTCRNLTVMQFKEASNYCFASMAIVIFSLIILLITFVYEEAITLKS